MAEIFCKIVLSLILSPAIYASEYKVFSTYHDKPNSNINYYANKSDKYFLSNSTFIFNPGKHSLNVYLKLSNVSNITFIGTNSSEIVMTGGGFLSCVNVTNMFVISIKLISRGRRTNDSLINIYNSNITFSNVIFKRKPFLKGSLYSFKHSCGTKLPSL